MQAKHPYTEHKHSNHFKAVPTSRPLLLMPEDPCLLRPSVYPLPLDKVLLYSPEWPGTHYG